MFWESTVYIAQRPYDHTSTITAKLFVCETSVLFVLGVYNLNYSIIIASSIISLLLEYCPSYPPGLTLCRAAHSFVSKVDSESMNCFKKYSLHSLRKADDS